MSSALSYLHTQSPLFSKRRRPAVIAWWLRPATALTAKMAAAFPKISCTETKSARRRNVFPGLRRSVELAFVEAWRLRIGGDALLAVGGIRRRVDAAGRHWPVAYDGDRWHGEYLLHRQRTSANAALQ